MHVRPSAASETILLELTTENGRISLGDTDGSISLRISDTVMENIAEGIYTYDLELVAPSATVFVYKILQGNFAVRSEVTR